MKLSLAEIIEAAAKEKKTENKIATLTMNDSPQLRKMIKYILDPEVVWWPFLKGDPPPYKPNRYLDAEGRLYQEVNKLYVFVESGDEWMGLKNEQLLSRMGLQKNPIKRQNKWIQFLESITPGDAELLINAPHKRFPWKGLNRKIIDEAFPGLLSPEKPLPEGHTAPPPVLEEKVAPSHGIPPQVPNPVELTIDDILK